MTQSIDPDQNRLGSTGPSAPPMWFESPRLGMLGSRALLSRLHWALEILKQSGIRVPATCRAKNAERLLKQLNDAQDFIQSHEHEKQKRVEAAHRTAWETFLITYAATLVPRNRTPFTREKLSTILGGADVSDGNKTLARDTQFELYVAAILTLGGAEVRPGEPDLRLLYGYERVGIAAKRISSLNKRQLKTHIEKAVSQIEGTGLRGFVAINFDSRFSGLRLSDERQSVLRSFEAAFDELNEFQPVLEANASVLGLMVYGYVTEWSFADPNEAPYLGTSAPFRWFNWGSDAGEQLLFGDFTARWRSSVEGHIRQLMSAE